MSTTIQSELLDPTTLAESLRTQGYVADQALVSTLYLSGKLGKPLLIEGEAGVGKTEIAKCLAVAHHRQLIRLQCYEGQDAQHALYDWDYQRQLLSIQMQGDASATDLTDTLYSEDFLLKRPLLQAIASAEPVVLLIDEVDRADQEFEALLLEILSDFQVSIPELGTYKAKSQPLVVLTSNGVRELSYALRRRCLYHYIDYPTGDKEQAIIKSRLPGINDKLTRQVVSFVQKLRTLGLRKTPGVAESIDWAEALMSVGADNLYTNPELSESTLSCLVKTRNDIELLKMQEISFKQAPVEDEPQSGSSSERLNDAHSTASNVKH